MNQNLLYLVARHNVERIHGDRRFDWIDNDFIKAVVAVGKKLPGRDHVRTSRRREVSTSSKKITAVLERIRKRGTK